MKKLIAFDMDGTLALSKQAIEPAMQQALKDLLDVAKVAIISGGDWPQFEKQVVGRLLPGSRQERLYIMPTTGSKLYQYRDGAWGAVYADNFDEGEGEKIRHALDKAVTDAGLKGEQVWGEQIEDRGSQITFSGLGQQAPLEAKDSWDPDQKKRRSLQATLQKELPELSINLGGTTSVDITRKGVDKAYAMGRLQGYADVTKDEMLFMGDATYEGGNDRPVPDAGYDTITVRDVRETETAISAVVACLKAA